MNHGLSIARKFESTHSHYTARIFRGANASSLSNLNPENKRRELVVLSALIEHPDVGLILYDAGCAEDLEVVCDGFLP